jgi:hypothetical protein
MDLTKEQKIMLQEIWNILKDKFIKFTGKTRSKEMSVIEGINNIGNEVFKLFYYNTTSEATLAKEFIQFAVDTIITTKSLDKTLNEVKKKYELS